MQSCKAATIGRGLSAASGGGFTIFRLEMDQFPDALK